MRKLPPLFSLATLTLISIGMPAPSIAQNAAGASNPEAVQQQRWSGSAADMRSVPLANHPRYVRYFSLEHRTPAQMDAADRDLVQSRSRELSIAAAIGGYDLSKGSWNWDQSICPAFPGTVMLHYLSKYPDGTQSLFTALVPRGSGPVRVVAALHRNAANYVPSVKDPHNYALFNSLVPADLAKRDSAAQGNWVMYGACYAEMVGQRPNIPDDPSLDVAMIYAPASTYRADEVKGSIGIQLPDREAANVYSIWTLALDKQGRIRSAMEEDYATYVAHVVKLTEPVGIYQPEPPQPAAKIVTPSDQPRITSLPTPNPPQQ